jgi:transposase
MARRPYPTDLTDGEWELLAPHIPEVTAGGRPAIPPRREIVDGILYVLRSGEAWRLVPQDFPPWQTLYHYFYFRRWRHDGIWEKAHTVLRQRARRQMGRDPAPGAAILGSQPVKTTEIGDVLPAAARTRRAQGSLAAGYALS